MDTYNISLHVNTNAEEDWDAESEESVPTPIFKLNLETIGKACGWRKNEEHKKLKEFSSQTSSSNNSTPIQNEHQGPVHCNSKIFEENGTVIVPYKIFVGNLSYGARKTEVIKFFSKFGKVENIHFITDHKSRRRKGSAFIKFHSQDAVEKAVRASEEELLFEDRQLRVFRANEKKRVLANERPHFKPPSHVPNEENTLEVDEVEDNQEQDETGSKTTRLQDLDDDTLLSVFSQLPLRDRVKIERVCVRWRSLALKTWQSLVTLDFKLAFQRFGEGLTDKILLSLLTKGCPNLKFLDLSSSPYMMTDWALEIIGDNCPKLSHLNLAGVPCTKASLKNLSEKCPQLQWITLQKCHGVGEKGLWWLFHQCKSLEYVDVEGNKLLTGQCFHMMGDKMKTLILNGCSKLIDVGLQKLDHCQSLQDLQLSDCVSLTDKGIQNIAEFCPSLMTLKLGGLFGKLSFSGLESLGKLKNLVDLHLANNAVLTDTALRAICKGCKQLRMLDISRCYQDLTSAGLDHLASLPCLETLNISYLPQVKDTTLRLLALEGKLRTTEVRACSSITNQGLGFLLENCWMLHHLDISGNFQITDHFLQVVVENSDERHNYCKSSLEIVVGGTSIGNWSTDQLKKAFISLKQQDFSDLHMRPDRDLYFNLGSDDEDLHEFTIERDSSLGIEDLAENYLYEDDPLMEEEWNVLEIQ